MATIFTRILNKELPGHFVYEDETCGVFLSIAPICPGHALVVPKMEIDHWVDLPIEVLTHCMEVANRIAKAQMKAFKPKKIAIIVAGLEVPHTHLHLIPFNQEAELSFSNAQNAQSEELAQACAAIRQEL